MKQNQTSKLRKNKKLGQDEWDNILLSVLLGTDANGNSVNTTNDVEAIADLAPDETSMTITIQNNIEGITVRHEAHRLQTKADRCSKNSDI